MAATKTSGTSIEVGGQSKSDAQDAMRVTGHGFTFGGQVSVPASAAPPAQLQGSGIQHMLTGSETHAHGSGAVSGQEPARPESDVGGRNVISQDPRRLATGSSPQRKRRN